MIYGSCANSSGSLGTDRERQRHDVQECLRHRVGSAHRAGLRPRRTQHHHDSRGIWHLLCARRCRHVDQLSFQAPFLPITFGALNPGCLNEFFSPMRRHLACPREQPRTRTRCLRPGNSIQTSCPAKPLSWDFRWRHDASGTIWVRRWKRGLDSHAVPICAGSTSPFRYTQYAAVEPDRSA